MEVSALQRGKWVRARHAEAMLDRDLRRWCAQGSTGRDVVPYGTDENREGPS